MIRRGDVYYIEGGMQTVGSEQHGQRPGVIISNDRENKSSGTVMVVYLTMQPKKKLPTHCEIRATGKKSTALCEQVFTVSASRIGRQMGRCTSTEMTKIDACLMVAMQLDRRNTEEQLRKQIREKDMMILKLTEAVKEVRQKMQALSIDCEVRAMATQKILERKMIEERRARNEQSNYHRKINTGS